MSTEPDENGNINCTNCTYCFSCTSCINCTGCTNCFKCTSCTSCTDCISCTNCTSCIYSCMYLDHCNSCDHCHYCVSCINCTDCTNLIKLNDGNNINNQIGNIYNVNENYINTDTININPVFSFTSGNVLFTNITPNTLSINETTGNISGVISALPTVTLTYRNQEYSYTFNTNVVRVYNVNLCNNYVVYS